MNYKRNRVEDATYRRWRPVVERLETRRLLASIDLFPVADNTLYEDDAGAISNGAGQHVFTGRTNQGDLRRGLFRFDIAASVPEKSAITGVTLQLHVSRSLPGTDTIALHRVLASWGEGTSDAGPNQPSSGAGSGEGQGASASPGDATWLDRTFGTVLWSEAGGDFDSRVTAGTPVGSAGDYTWSSPQMVRDVQAWLDDPSTDFGWILIGNEGSNGSAIRFDSRENNVVDNRPVLTVDFTSNNAAPTDITLSNNAVSEASDVADPFTLGTLSAVDADEGDSHTFTIVDGPGATDNDLFQIVDDQLQLVAGAALDHETRATLAVGVSTSDAAGESTTKLFVVDVTDANEPPTLETALEDVILVGGNDFTFGVPADTFVDPDANDALTLSAQLPGGAPLPTWLDFDPSAETFSGQAGDDDAAIFQIVVTASDSGQPSLQTSDTLRLIVTRSTVPWQSPDNALDVDGDDFVAPIDVLIVINELNDQQHSDGQRRLIGLPAPGVGLFDVNGDGFATPLDALQIINFLNSDEGEGEAVHESHREQQPVWNVGRPSTSTPSSLHRAQRSDDSITLEEYLDDLG